MPALAVLAFITILLVRHTDRRMIGAPEIRRIHAKGVVTLVGIGVVASVLYTWELSVLGQTEIGGDASKFLEAAEALIDGQDIASVYPVYDFFLAAFLWYGGPFIARIGQLLLLVCSYSLGGLGLVRLGLSRRTFRWYSCFVCFNGIFYGLATQLVRDALTLTAFAFAFLCLASLQSTPGPATNAGAESYPKPLLVARRQRSRSLATKAGAVLAGAVSIVLLMALSNWLLFVLVVAAAAEVVGGVFSRAKYPQRAGVLICVTAAVTVASATQFQHWRWLYKVNIQEDIPRQEAVKTRGVYNPRSALDLFRNILGPGLIRPIFWHKYFWYSTNAHSGFYWWGTLVWYLLLLIAGPALLLNIGRLRSARGVRFCLTTVVVLLSIYSYTYGSGVGMRKRAVFQFLALLGFCSAGCFEGRRKWISDVAADGRRALLTAALLTVIVAANYMSLD